MNELLLSVVVPVLNPDRHLVSLQKLFQSAPLEGVEFIVIHDCRTGESSQKLIQLIEDFPMTTIKLVKGNFGSAGIARNAGMLTASSRWISFCDADDYQHVGTILKEIEKDSSAELLIGQFKRVNQTGKVIDSVSTNAFSDLWVDPGFWRIVYKRGALSQVNFTNLKMGEDIVFLAEVLRKNPTVSFRHSLFYEYTIGNLLQSTSEVSNFNDVSRAIKAIKTQNPYWGKNDNDLGFITRLTLTHFIHSLNRAKYKQMVEIWKIVRCNPKIFLYFLKHKYHPRNQKI